MWNLLLGILLGILNGILHILQFLFLLLLIMVCYLLIGSYKKTFLKDLRFGLIENMFMKMLYHNTLKAQPSF